MVRNIFEAILIIGVPIIVFVGCGWLMLEVSGRNEFKARQGLDQPRSLNSRPFGYQPVDVNEYWEKLGPDGRIAEMRFLKLDLVFPLLYCAAIAFGFVTGWERLGLRTGIVPILCIILIVLISDWSENLIHINQLNNLITIESYELRQALIQVASVATILKIWLVTLLAIALLILAGLVGFGFRSSSS